MAPIAGLAAKAVPMLLDNAPEIWAAATQLLQSARRAKAEIPIDPVPAGAAAEAPALDAAIRDIEASLLTLNDQMVKSGALVASLARQNELLAARIDKLQTWMLGLAVLTGGSIAVAVAAVAILLSR